MSINEIAVISGKGGTGKTSITASLIPYLDSLVIADCDVDAPDLNILVNGRNLEFIDFYGFKRPVIDDEKCTKCGICYDNCNFNAINENISIKENRCEGCHVCELVCPNGAITMIDYKIGDIFIRNSDYGLIVDAKLIPGEESSGKLVSEVRNLAKREAKLANKENILIDGSPGIACNVISAITGVNKVLIVTEPSISGLHDLKKVYKLTQTFSLETAVIINKSDLNTELNQIIKDYCKEEGILLLMEIPYTKSILHAINNKEIPSNTEIELFKSKEWNDVINFVKKTS